MSRPVVVLLEGTHAWVLPARGAFSAVPYGANGNAQANTEASAAPDLSPVREAILASGAARDVMLVIGGAWLQSARPTLPPVAAADRRRVLHHQADRFFAVRGPVASTVYDHVAVACDAAWLRGVRDQFAGWTTLRAVLALPDAVAAAGLGGTWHADATAAAPGAMTATILIELEDGAVRDARVVRGAAPSSSRALDRERLLRAVQTAGERPWPRPRQLLDVATDDALARAEQRAWWRAGALLAGALALLTWAVGQQRARQLASAESAQQAAEREAAPALAAQARLLLAEQESAWLTRANAAALAPGAPSHVIATLGRLFPASAFVQHLEWDGRQWKIDGSAVDAAALVPSLDAVPAFEQVRTLAPSTRFLDGGTPRSSFSIGFQVKESPIPPGGSRGER